MKYILLYFYVHNELSYDQYHKDKEQLYRIEVSLTEGDRVDKFASAPAILATTLQEYPEVKFATKIDWMDHSILKVQNNKFQQDEIYYADPSVFETLTLTPVVGNVQEALKHPKTIVLTRSLANKFFRSPHKALGKSLIIDDSVNYKVTAVIEDIPQNSHFKPEAFVSMSTLHKTNPKNFTLWWGKSLLIYLKLKKGASPAKVEAVIAKLKNQHLTKMRGKKTPFELKMWLQPVTDIHFYSKDIMDDSDKGDITIVYIFMVIGVLILLIACANYMNLATARSIERAKEVGIRKVVGSHRRQLIVQFLTESILLSLIALLISMSLVELTLPQFNLLANKKLSVSYFTQPYLVLKLLGIALFTGVVSGSYPAFVLSSFKPWQVLKGKFSRSRQGIFLRKSLVVFQFGISLIMIIGTWIVYQQLQYVKNKDLGFDKEQTIKLEFGNNVAGKKHAILKQELLKNPHIKKVAGSSAIMGRALGIQRIITKEKNGNKVHHTVRNCYIDADYTDALGIRLIQGQNFQAKTISYINKPVIVNEAFVRKYNLKNPVGTRIELAPKPHDKKKRYIKIAGVVADFHIESLYTPIVPFIMEYNLAQKNSVDEIFIKIQPQDMPQTLAFIKKTWEKVYPKHLYQSEFLNQKFAAAYQADQKRGQVFLVFSGVAIFIACLGLFGLTAYTTHQRRKEIGIRKVLGASITQIMVLLSRSFVQLLLFASLLAFPLAYYLMNQWLQSFAYRINLHWSIFAGAGLATLAIALFTISFQSLRTAKVNPVEVLKNE